jgi:outer membrane protein
MTLEIPGLRVAAAVLGMMLGGVCAAQTLSTLLEQARSSEPSYLGAKTGVDAAKARSMQVAGAMLPQVNASANTTHNKRYYETRGTFFQPDPELQKDSYNSHSGQITLTQPLWRHVNTVSWLQAQAASAQAGHQLASAEQELVARLVAAWCDLLAARDSAQFTAQQVAATQRQWEVLRRGEELGANGVLQAEEARAKLDQALSDAVTAEMDVHLKQAALEQIVGSGGPWHTPYLRKTAAVADLGWNGLDKWLQEVENANPNVLAARQAFEAASKEVSKQRAGHQPTLDLVGSYGTNGQTVGGFPGQAGYEIRQGSVGLQLNMPLFSGGTQWAKTDEALAQKEKARLEIEVARRAAVLATKQAWFGWQAGSARAQAGAQGIKAAQAALATAQRGSAYGLRTELEILQAQQQLHAGQRDFRKGRYDQIVAFVRLKALTGAMTTEDVAAIDAAFVPTPEDDNEQASLRGPFKENAARNSGERL